MQIKVNKNDYDKYIINTKLTQKFQKLIFLINFIF